MELAAVMPPWPKWTNIEVDDTAVAIALAAERVLSAHAGDALDPKSALSLLGGLIGDHAEVHAWLYALRDYRRQLLHTLGRNAIHGVAADIGAAFMGNTADMAINPSPLPTQLADDFDALIVISCSMRDLLQVGLPPTFLRLGYSIDRIGLAPLCSLNIRHDRYPSVDEMLDSYELVAAACGEHYSDCLVASSELAIDSLISLLQSAARRLGWPVDYVGSVSGEMYEHLYERTL